MSASSRTTTEERMRLIAMTLLTLIAALSGCSDDPDPDTGTHVSADASVEDAGEDVRDVGSKSEALSACYAAKSKAKARYNCTGGWAEYSNELLNTSYLCPYQRHYSIWLTPTQPA